MKKLDFVEPEKMWRTKEINPQEIARVLRGKLRKYIDADSQWDIYLDYGLILKIHPEKRKIFISIPGPNLRCHKTYRCSVEFADVEDLLFAQYHNPDSGRLETDVVVNVRNTGSGLIAANAIISSWAHRTFECKTKKS